MTEIGKIIKTSGKLATVRIMRHSACGNCGKCGMGNALHTDFSAINNCNAKVGDTVQLEIKKANTLKMSVFAYLLPLLFGLALFFLGYFLQLPEWAYALMFLGGFAGAFVVAYFVDRRKNHKWSDSPQILSILQEEEQNNNEQSERTE